MSQDPLPKGAKSISNLPVVKSLADAADVFDFGSLDELKQATDQDIASRFQTLLDGAEEEDTKKLIKRAYKKIIVSRNTSTKIANALFFNIDQPYRMYLVLFTIYYFTVCACTFFTAVAVRSDAMTECAQNATCQHQTEIEKLACEKNATMFFFKDVFAGVYLFDAYLGVLIIGIIVVEIVERCSGDEEYVDDGEDGDGTVATRKVCDYTSVLSRPGRVIITVCCECLIASSMLAMLKLSAQSGGTYADSAPQFADWSWFSIGSFAFFSYFVFAIAYGVEIFIESLVADSEDAAVPMPLRIFAYVVGGISLAAPLAFSFLIAANADRDSTEKLSGAVVMSPVFIFFAARIIAAVLVPLANICCNGLYGEICSLLKKTALCFIFFTSALVASVYAARAIDAGSSPPDCPPEPSRYTWMYSLFPALFANGIINLWAMCLGCVSCCNQERALRWYNATTGAFLALLRTNYSSSSGGAGQDESMSSGFLRDTPSGSAGGSGARLASTTSVNSNEPRKSGNNDTYGALDSKPTGEPDV